MFIKLVFSLFLLMLFSSCISVSSYQTADTLEKGDVELALGIGIYPDVAPIAGGYSEEEEEEMAADKVMPELISRFGLLDDLDMGLKFLFNSVVELDFKFRFLSFGDDENRFSMAIKPMVSMNFLLADKFALFLLDSARISLLISKNFNKNFGVYTALNYNPNFSSGRKTLDDEFGNPTYSMVLGLSISSENVWFRPELVIANIDSEIFTRPGVAIGLVF